MYQGAGMSAVSGPSAEAGQPDGSDRHVSGHSGTDEGGENTYRAGTYI